MTDETDTTSPDVTEGVEPTEDENAEPTTYWDPDEDTPEEETAKATDEAVEEVAETEEAPAPTLVKLADGSELTLEEVTKGYLRQSDYTRKTQELVQTRKSLETDLQRIEGITQAFVDHLSAMVPALPDPSVALRDPNGYVRQKAQHDAAMAQVQKLIELGTQPKEIAATLNNADTRNRLAEEKQRLAERFPEIATKEGQEKFFASTAEAAQEAGFTLEELNGITDHRLFVLAHWAKEGMKAAQARQVAKAKVANVPPATPRRPGQPAQVNRNAEAMRKLSKSGSIRDALSVNWD